MEECKFLKVKINTEKIQLKTGNKVSQVNSQPTSDVQIPDQKWYRDNSSRYFIQKYIEQEKYNLLREESEGYSKMIVILNQNCINLNQSQITELAINVQKIVHLFNLEILKVIDLILESFEIALGSFVDSLSNSESYILSRQETLNIINVYTQLIDIFLHDSEKKQKILASLLGFKLSYILNTQDISNLLNLNPKKVVPYNLILLIAILIREELILSEEILPYFIKKNKIYEKDSEDKVINIKFDEVSDDVESYHQILQALYDKKYQGLEVNIIDPKVKLQVQQNFEQQRSKAQTLRQSKLPYNYILWLITCLIQLNDYDDAEILISSFWGDERIDLTIHKDLLLSLNSYLDATIPIDKMYLFWLKQNFVSKFTKHSKGLMELEPRNLTDILVFNLQKILKIQYYFIGTNQQVFLRLLESVNRSMLQVENNQSESIKKFAFKIAGEYFLPALCLTNEKSSSLDNELWKIFEKMNYQERFQYYQYLLSKVYLTNINMLNKFVELCPRVIKWTKSLSIEKQQIEMMKNETISISNGGNTLIIANQIVKICSNYNNLFKPLILSMEKQVFNSLALDMVSFSIIKNLSDNQESYKNIDSEANAPISLTYISEFASIFYKNFPQVELFPLIQYVLNRLADGNNSYEALILSNLIQSMSGWKDLEISLLNEKQLQCLAGGIILKIDIMEQSAEFKKSQKSQKRALQNVFYNELYTNKDQNGQNEQSFSFRLMVNLAIQCKNIIDNLQTEDISLIQNFFDKIHQIFIQIVDTIYFINQDQEKYKKLMPKKEQISNFFVKQYGGIPYYYAIYILRRSFNQLADMSDQEFQEMTNTYVGIFDSYLQNNIDVCQPKILLNNEVDANWSENSQDQHDDFPYFNEEQFLIKKNTDKWKNFKQEIFAIFWQLELQDIELPTAMYEDQIKLKEKEISKKSQDRHQQENERDQKKINKEVEAIQKIKQELKDELNKVQKVRHQKTSEFLKKKLPQLFQQIEDENGVSKFFVQYCLYPRLMFSPSDAIFCIKFIHILVDLKLSKINILNIFAQIMKSIIPTIHCCTSNESENLGIFFMEWFKMIDRWSKSNEEGKKIWQNECAQYQGFSKQIGQLNIITQEEYKSKIVKPINIRFLQFLKMCFKNPKKHHIKTKSALKILYRIRSIFPKDRNLGDEILKELKQIQDMNREIQQDIWTLANRYHNDLSEIVSKFPVLEQESIKTNQEAQTNQQINQTTDKQITAAPQQNLQKEVQNKKSRGDGEKNNQTHSQPSKTTEHHKDQPQQSQKDVEMKNQDRNTRNTSNRETQNQQHRENQSKSNLGKRKIQTNDNREAFQSKKLNLDEQQKHQEDNKNMKQNQLQQKAQDHNQEKLNNNQNQEKKRIEKQNLKSAERSLQIQNQIQAQNKKSEPKQQAETNLKQNKQNEDNNKSQQNVKQQGIAAEIIEKTKGSQKVITIDEHQQIQRKEISIVEQNPAFQQNQQTVPDFEEALKKKFKEQEKNKDSSRIVVNEKISTPQKRQDEPISQYQQPTQRSQIGQNSSISNKQQKYHENAQVQDKNVIQQQKYDKQQVYQGQNSQKIEQNLKIQKNEQTQQRKENKQIKEDVQQNFRSQYKERSHERSQYNQKRGAVIDSQDYREYQLNQNQPSYQHKSNSERVYIDSKMEDSFKSNSKNRIDDAKWSQRSHHPQQLYQNEKGHQQKIVNSKDKQHEQIGQSSHQKNIRDDRHPYSSNQGQYQQSSQSHRSAKQSGQRNNQNQNDKYQ